MPCAVRIYLKTHFRIARLILFIYLFIYHFLYHQAKGFFVIWIMITCISARNRENIHNYEFMSVFVFVFVFCCCFFFVVVVVVFFFFFLFVFLSVFLPLLSCLG